MRHSVFHADSSLATAKFSEGRAGKVLLTSFRLMYEPLEAAEKVQLVLR